jgi:hypothetical protein
VQQIASLSPTSGDISRAVLDAFALDVSGIPKRKEEAKAHNGNER